MYQGRSQGDFAEQDTEMKAEYLLGKECVGEGAMQGDFDAGDQKDAINNVLKAPVLDQGDLSRRLVISQAFVASSVAVTGDDELLDLKSIVSCFCF
jgi:hypothetical protein